MILLVDRPFELDTREDYFFIAAGVILILALTFTLPVDAHFRAVVNDFDAYFTDTGDANISFDRDAVRLMNDVSSESVGGGAFADERLYCFDEVNGVATDFRFADFIEGSTLTSVAGGCVEPVNGFVHSQPGGSSQLSEEDRSLESVVDWTCIQYDEIVESPVTGSLTGINCWKVVDQGASFVPVNVGVVE